MKEDAKKSEAIKYPQSAELFKFCKEALNIKHNFEVKVIDQHVGAILGFDPADCSHWKKGKKSIKSLQTINSIAKHLDVDARLVSDLIYGKTDLEEAIQEFRGYGPMEPSQKYYEELKREYFKDPSRFAVNGTSRSLEEVIKIDRPACAAAAEAIISKAQISSYPVFLEEVCAAVDGVRLVQAPPAEGEEGDLVSVRVDPSPSPKFTIRIRPGEMKPHVRFLAAKALGQIVLDPHSVGSQLSELQDARANQFALLLLMPPRSFGLALREVDDTRDIIQQLAEIFWLSRSVANSRMKDYFRHGS